MTDSSLLHRLRERKLVQWALAYLAGAFVVFQGVEVMAEPWGITPALQRAIHILLLIGLCVMLVLAWYHGEKGQQRVSGPELLMIALLLVIAGTGISLLRGGEEAPEPTEPAPITAVEDERPSIAVLPFQNRSGIEDDAYFTDGVHDQIITQLAKISGLSVRGLTSVLVYRDSPKNLREIGEELNARYIVEGGVQRAGEMIRINVQLIEAATDEHIWASTYDRTMSVENVFSIQTEIVEAVADSVRAVVTPEERIRIEARPTDNLRAYDLYLLGRSRWVTRQIAGMYEATDFYEAAIAEDSAYALAYSGLAETYMLIPEYSPVPVDRQEIFRRAREAAEQALALSPDLSEAHAALGYVAFIYDWEWDTAERELHLATTLDPGNTQARSWYAELLISLGRYDEALAQASRAAQADPHSIIPNTTLGLALWNAGRLAEAEQQLRYAIDLEFGDQWAAHLAVLLTEQGRHEEAREAMNRALRGGVEDEVVDSLNVVGDALQDPSLHTRAVAILRSL